MFLKIFSIVNSLIVSTVTLRLLEEGKVQGVLGLFILSFLIPSLYQNKMLKSKLEKLPISHKWFSTKKATYIGCFFLLLITYLYRTGVATYSQSLSSVFLNITGFKVSR